MAIAAAEFVGRLVRGVTVIRIVFSDTQEVREWTGIETEAARM